MRLGIKDLYFSETFPGKQIIPYREAFKEIFRGFVIYRPLIKLWLKKRNLKIC